MMLVRRWVDATAQAILM